MTKKPTYEELEQRVKGLEQEAVDRKRAENALKASEKNYRAIFESVNDAIIIHDAQTGRPLEINSKMEELLGYSREELTQMKVADWTLGDPTIMQKKAMRTIKGAVLGEPQLFEWHVKRKDSKLIWVEVNLISAVIRGQKCVLAVVRDITERKQAEEARRESEKKYRTLFDMESDALALIEIETGKMLDVNKAFIELYGYSKKEILRMKNTDFSAEPEMTNQATQARGTYVPIRYHKKKDGTVFPTEITARIFKYQERDVHIAAIRDITERKRLETQLQQAQRMEAIGTLAGGVAHDLNNILSGIVSYPELILMDLPEDSPLRKPILTIQKSGEKAAVIVQDLLTLARRGVSIADVVNLNHIISEQLKSPEFEKLISFHPDVQAKTDLEKDLLNIKGSSTHLSKSVMNILSNAAEAMPDGGTVLISTENLYLDRPIKGYNHVESGEYVTVTFSDTGMGIPEEDSKRIFEPFYTKKVMGRSGTGLGMAVVWGTVKDHKGYINIQSSVGKGTTFTLYFPVTREESAKDESLLPIVDYMGKGELILVVDDVEEQKEIATEMLRKLGYSVTSVSSGEEAVEYLKTDSADLIVLDMIMDPGINGRETYERIINLHPNQKAIIASGFSETENVKATQKLGAGQYIKKPYTLEKIGIAVRDELKK